MRLLMGTRTDPNGEPEAEPVLVEWDGGPNVLLTLDDGTSVVLDRHELAAAIRALAFDTETAA